MKFEYSNIHKPFWNTIYLFVKSYPIHNPTKLIRKKFYLFFFTLSNFIPNETIKSNLNFFIKKYPISPYLDNRLNLLKWVNFIHNRMDKKYGMTPITLKERLENFNKTFFPPIKKTFKSKLTINRKNVINIIILLLTVYIVYSFI